MFHVNLLPPHYLIKRQRLKTKTNKQIRNSLNNRKQLMTVGIRFCTYRLSKIYPHVLAIHKAPWVYIMLSMKQTQTMRWYTWNFLNGQ